MRFATVYDFPSFDTGQYEGTTFQMRRGNAELTVHIHGIGHIFLKFDRLRWHEFTALYNCSPEQIKTAYFKLTELEGSDRLARYIASDQASIKAYRELHHYRIFIVEHGCHEIFAETVSTTIAESDSAHFGA